MVCGMGVPAACQSAPEKPAEALYLKLRNVGLDPARVYQVRGASIDRASIHISLDDGIIGFTQDVYGRITGAFFEGDGQVLLVPPNEVERRSMGLFTGMAILEEPFATAYFRFNDDVAAQMRPDLRATDNQKDFIDRWGETARNLARGDALRLLVTMSRQLPVIGEASAESASEANDRFLHARLQGVNRGVFDIYFDSLASEQIQAGQAKPGKNGVTYYDVWTSFSVPVTMEKSSKMGAKPEPDPVRISRYAIRTEVEPPKQIRAHARLEVEVKDAGQRVLLFELSRFLEVTNVKMDGQPVEFIHNAAVEGTELARSGNDFVAVILPQPARAGQKMELEFDYAGDVLEQEGSGLLYVGARGMWYPNRGMEMASFDLEFDYPPGWTLVATGVLTPSSPSAEARAEELESSHWISERDMPLAGFNLGKYKEAKTQAGKVSVETYATVGLEKSFPVPPMQTIDPLNPERQPAEVPAVVVPLRPSPARNESNVGEAAAQAIEYYAKRFGPFPYSHLLLTQMPGHDSQGWPGLIFLSSYAFLTNEERQQLHFDPERIVQQQTIAAHETAHQWWGDLVGWDSYRDQWFSEGLANYCALMMLEEKDPDGFHQIMERYRQDLMEENKDGLAAKDAGPVTLGYRLLSSRFPEGYEAIDYGRGTWLFHMLRTMLRDAETQPGHKFEGGEEPFVRVLRKVREEYADKTISTQQLMDAFAENLPPALRYEGKKSLDWFVEGWVNGTSLPTLQLAGVKFTTRASESIVTGMILQKDAPEDLVTSVPVYAVTTGRAPRLLGRVFADGAESSFRITGPAGIRKIVLDPYQTVLTSPKK